MGMPSWLENIVFYEIYPQTFLDTDGDGIGNIQGIIRKLDYIKNMVNLNMKLMKEQKRYYNL